ncbi:DUF4384 domain-containing protein [Aggregicoccus sp. 17bor-14]|uniref:DUF4384 domain-containing protein n=1 Tax=Myxococcaceae TaxID=31 RepID=UPI00129C1818|nr:MULTISPECIES: DUF4384 domain-containing protein [Myxococcaceae]MBF5041648.1 DUF4384 domain-containing protein [Simulacricoccus sp. 17bor-14]MRI87432.1 DUF4384 domain-containing protein [Aggregicoccus sp. 17bor-14]
MKPLPPSPRGPQCPPAAVLEALSAGERVPEPTRAHVQACPDCSAQLQALQSAQAAFLQARPPERFLRQVERREEAPKPSRLPRLLPLIGGLLVPLVAIVLFAPRGGQHPHEDPGVTLKGGGLRVAVARGGSGAPELLENDGAVRAGDALRFSYEAPGPGHLLVLELDGRGEASVFHPFNGATSTPLAAGQRDFLPGSVVLDAAPGPELLVAVFSPRPLEAAPLLEQLRAQAGRPEPTLTCDGCRVSTLRLQKRP